MTVISSSAISELVGSSQHGAITNDSLKDEDNAAWVLQLESSVRREWIERITWIRVVDRLAEGELIERHSSGFWRFREGWKSLMASGCVNPAKDYQGILAKIHDRWFTGSSPDWVSIRAWDRYVDAIETYHQPNLTIDTLMDYEDMLGGLAGSFSQVLPFLAQRHQELVFHLGVLDQFYNNLRDLGEDANRGICYFPTQVLGQFGLNRSDILQLRCFDHPGYYQLMQFWMDEYLPTLRAQAGDLTLLEDLHPSWQILRDWSLYRYSRIERILRRVDLNFVRFQNLYWAEVKSDLQGICCNS